jgi:hypothetical protein
MIETSEAVRWGLRLALAIVAAFLVVVATLRGADRVTELYPPVQTEALATLSSRFGDALATKAPDRLEIVVFGDSLIMPENYTNASKAFPARLEASLAARLAGPLRAGNVRVVPVVYSALSQNSLYYMTDSVLELMPDLVVIEFNLYNFSAFWEGRERKILAAFLEPSHIIELATLPVTAASQATDQWLYDRALLRLGWLETWNLVQREQARLNEARWLLADGVQQCAGSSILTLRYQTRNLEIKRISQTPTRSTAFYARQLFGPALTGIRKDEPALQVLAATLRRLASAGVPALVYVPPYNVEHLSALGVLDDARFAETIGHVRSVAGEGGAFFADLHGLLGDSSFRDNMDHLCESGGANGHDLVARSIANVIGAHSAQIFGELR